MWLPKVKFQAQAMYLASHVMRALPNPIVGLANGTEEQAQTQSTQLATVRKHWNDLTAWMERQRHELSNAAAEERGAGHTRK